MRDYSKSFARAIVLVVFAGTVNLNARVAPQDTTVCELFKDSAHYSQKAVRVRAFVRSDLIHATLLMEEGCSGVGIALASGDWKDRPVSLEKNESYRQLEALLPQVIELEQKGQRIFGTFEGFFEWSPDGMPSRTLILHQVSNLQVGGQDLPKYTPDHKK